MSIVSEMSGGAVVLYYGSKITAEAGIGFAATLDRGLHHRKARKTRESPVSLSAS